MNPQRQPVTDAHDPPDAEWFGGISERWPVKAVPALKDGRPAYVGQALHGIDGVMYGGTLAVVAADTKEHADELAESLADAWNQRAQRIRENK